jgi:MerC mercury resistance protein
MDRRPHLDLSALALSGLCLVHCLAGSLLVTVFAAGGDWLGHDAHLWGLAIALPLAAVALWRGVARHGRASVALVGAAGLVLMAASLFASHGGAEVPLSIAGVALLGLAHWWNLRAVR